MTDSVSATETFSVTESFSETESFSAESLDRLHDAMASRVA